MSKKNKTEPSGGRDRFGAFRLWPGVFLAILLVVVRFGVSAVMPGSLEVAIFGGLLGGVAILVWWAFFSRAPRIERFGAVVLSIAALIGFPHLTHVSIATGMQGMMFIIYTLPVLSLALVVWAVVTRRLSNTQRRLTMVLTVVSACGVWTLFRSRGITGFGGAQFAWRWTETAEEKLLTRGGDVPVARSPEAVPAASRADWPGFRGPRRDGTVTGLRIETDWTTSPPVELWRRPVGPGCSSFAVRGGCFYTQEQRGEDEIVACYKLSNGKAVWKHRDKARFWDSHAGAGPRSTPALAGGRVYTLGATGILNVLDADSGSVIWSRNAVTDTDTKIPGWGITGSPLVVGHVVIVAVSGTIAAYDIVSGEPRWTGPQGGESYSSPHLFTIDGVPQVLLMSKSGTAAYAPADGTLLWEHPGKKVRVIQPALTPNGDILLSAGEAKGIHRITVTEASGTWACKEQWTTRRLRPNFNDIVLHKGHIFGFNGPSLVCIDLETGNHVWKGGNYTGQLLLLAEQDFLLVVSEKGELALVNAVSREFNELARFPAVRGKTWNHPALAGDILLIRNSHEMAAFRLPLVEG